MYKNFIKNKYTTATIILFMFVVVLFTVGEIHSSVVTETFLRATQPASVGQLLVNNGREQEVQFKSKVPDAGEIKTIMRKDKPEVTLTRWNGKAPLTISYDKINTTGRRDFLSNRMRWRGNGEDMRSYPLASTTHMEDGGLEIDLELKRKPSNNVFNFTLSGTKNLNFYYQPPLSVENYPGETCTATTCTDDITGKITRERPEDVIGSYAVYYKKSNNLADGINYATGKAYHIYRPKIIDKTGNSIWGTLSYQNGTLRVTVPQTFLDTATYPIVVDPTFGYTTAGATKISIEDRIVWEYASPTSNGTVDSITLYAADINTTSHKTTMALYNSNSATDVGSLIATTSEQTITTADNGTWVTFSTWPGGAPAVTAGTNYFIAAFAEAAGGRHRTSYDSGGTTRAAYVNSTYTSGYPDPPTGEVTATADASMYVTYTADATSTPPAEYTQNDWRWYANANSVQPGSALASENATTTAVAVGDILRLRLNLKASSSAATGTDAFRLQYSEGASCSTASGWTDVAATSSGLVGQYWVQYDNSTPADGATTTSSLLASSTVKGSYEESNPSVANLYALADTDQVEFDWVLKNNGAKENTNYCFRMVKDDYTVLTTYNSDSYPKLTTASASVTESAFRWRSDDGVEGNITAFGNAGTTTSNPSSGSDFSYSVTKDNNYLYMVGFENVSGSDDQWRVEKRDITTGALVTAFGTNGATTTNPSVESDQIIYAAVDDTYLYIVGTVNASSSGSTDDRWRLEKLNKTTGALVTTFGTNGVVTSDPTTNTDSSPYVTLAIDKNYIYLAGHKFIGTGDRDWRIEKYDISTGALVTEFGTNGVVDEAVGAKNDIIYSITVDNEFIYIGGADRSTQVTDYQWRAEKRNKTTGALQTGFGTGGIVTDDVAVGENEYIRKVKVDAGYLYLAGDARDQTVPTVNNSIQIQKRNIVTGNLCDSTTNCAEGAFDTDGRITENVGDNHDGIISFDLDADALYLGGLYEVGSTDQAFFLEKRNRKTGALCTSDATCYGGAFDTDGKIQNNPSANYEQYYGVVIDDTYIYTAGREESLGSTNSQWEMEKRYKDDGSLVSAVTGEATWLAAEDTVPTIAKNTNTRLRFSLANAGNAAIDYNYRLQVAAKGGAGSCEVVSSGSFADVPVAGSCGSSVACMVNSTLTNAERTTSQLTSTATNFVFGEVVENTSNETGTSTLYKNQYTEHEYALNFTDNAAYSTNYCFRLVDQSSALATYTKVAEAQTEAPPTITISGILYSDEGNTAITTGPTVKLVVGTSTPVTNTAVVNGSGGFTFSVNQSELAIDTPILVFVDASTTLRAAVQTKLASTTADLTLLNLYQDRVIVRQEGSTSTSLTDLATYDSTDDSDIQFTASSTLNTLDILNGQELYVWSGDTFIAPTGDLTLTGNYTNNGIFSNNSGTVVLGGTSVQTATGTLSGSSAFYNLSISNTSANGTTSQSIVFGAVASTSNTFSMVASTSAQFLANATNTFQNIDIQGGSASSEAWLRSSISDTVWYMAVPGNATTTFANIKDSNVCGSAGGGLIATSSTDVSGNTCWTFTSGVSAGELVLANSSAGQVNNTFSFQNKTSTPMFAFKLSTSTESVTVSNTVFDLSGIRKVTDSNISNFKLYKDINSDGAYDGGDIQIGGSGVLSITDTIGNITFSSSFVATSSQDYVLIGDTTVIKSNSQITFNLFTSGITATGDSSAVSITPSGSVSSVQHYRTGGGGGSSAVVGDPAPAGNGDVGGGTNEGGQLIGSNPDFYRPSANSGSWTTPANAYDATDGTYASASTNVTHNFTNYSFIINGNDQIDGVEVKLEISGTTAAGNIGVELSWDGGTSWTSSGNTTPTLTTSDTVVTLGGAGNKWGRTWTTSDFSNANFAVRLTANPSSNTVQVDELQVNVHHSTTGGGQGGGGGI